VNAMNRTTTTLVFFLALILLAPQEACDLKNSTSQQFARYIGKWTLLKSSDPSDSLFYRTSWISLAADSTFRSNTSFFWNPDTQKNSPLAGTWAVSEISGIIFHDPDVEGTVIITLTVDKTRCSWDLYGNGTQDSTMRWNVRNGEWQYSWTMSN